MKKYIITEKGKKLLCPPEGHNQMSIIYDSMDMEYAIEIGLVEEVKEPELFGWDVEAKTLYKISGEDWTHEEHQLLVNAYNFEFGKIKEAIDWAIVGVEKWYSRKDKTITLREYLETVKILK